MLVRVSVLIFTIAISALVSDLKTFAQDINTLKSGVVRIQNNKLHEVGTGFIVKVDGNQAYIITAAHVVRGDQHPSVNLYNHQQDALRAEVLDREEDDTKGLALLRLKLLSTAATGIMTLKLGYTSNLNGGEDVKVIGFPDGTAFWTVNNGSVARIEGRNLVFSDAIRGGNSGGPVILNGVVIGMVTDVSQSSAYAARGETIETYANGIVANLISIGGDVRRSDFCRTLNELLDASRTGFDSIVGEAVRSSEGTFLPKILLPGATNGYVVPPKNVYYYLLVDKDKGKVESLFYSYVAKVRGCSSNWEEKEDSDSTYRYRKYRRNAGEAVVAVYYNPVAQNSNYYLTLDIAVPDSRRRGW